MVQRRSAPFGTNRYRNTSSVTDMLDYLGWKSHETRRSKLQLIVLYKIVHGLIDIPPTDYLTQTNSRNRSAHISTSISSTLHLQIVLSTAFSRVQSHSGTIPGRVAQSVTCLATDACLTADPGVASSIPVPYFCGG